MKLTRIYGFLNGMMPNGKFIVTAVTDYGKSVCSYFVTSENEARVKLGMNGTINEAHDKYRAIHPEGVTLEWIPFNMTSTHQGLRDAINEHIRSKGVN